MPSFILIFVCMALGWILRRRAIFDATSVLALNRFVIYISLPAVTILQIQRLEASLGVWVPISMPWLLFVLGFFYFSLIRRLLKQSQKTFGALLLTGSLGNTSFVGFPLLEAFYGTSAIAIGILTDQPGTFFVLGTLGIAAASFLSQSRPSLRSVLLRIIKFPPFVALIVALALRPVHLGISAVSVLERLSSTLIPLALVSVGAQLRLSRAVLSRRKLDLAAGLLFKLVIAPVFFFAVYYGVFGERGQIPEITVIESAMAPMITAAIVAEEYGLDTEIANLMVGLGIPLSLLSVPLIYWLLRAQS